LEPFVPPVELTAFTTEPDEVDLSALVVLEDEPVLSVADGVAFAKLDFVELFVELAELAAAAEAAGAT